MLAPISAFNFNEIALEIGSGFQLEDDDLRLGARYDRYHGQFHPTNFKDNITLVKLMSAMAGERFAVAFRVLGGNEGRLNPNSEVGLWVAATPRRRKVRATPSSPVGSAAFPKV